MSTGHCQFCQLHAGVQGVGSACTYLGSLVYMLKAASEAGLPDSEQTKGMVSSLWTVADCVGGYIGSSAGGLAYDVVGFKMGTLLECCLVASSLGLMVLFMSWRWTKRTGKVEREGGYILLGGQEENKKLINHDEKEEEYIFNQLYDI